MKISNVIPVYNSEKSLHELCSRLTAVYEKVIKADYELILVNDCSSDNSWNVLKELHASNQNIKVINLAKNAGQHAATLCGLKYCTGDFVVLLDDDLQHPPEEIVKLVSCITADSEIDVVIGSYEKKKHSAVRNIGSHAMKYTSAYIHKSKDNLRLTSFRIMRISVAREVVKIQVHKPRIGYLIRMTTNRISSVIVEHHQRKYGSSGYTFVRLVKDFILNIINNTTLPLKMISIIGTIISIFSMLFAMYLIGRFFFGGHSVKGWTSLMVTVSFFSGFILFTLGIIGEYLLRILIETKKLPLYHERETHI